MNLYHLAPEKKTDQESVGISTMVEDEDVGGFGEECSVFENGKDEKVKKPSIWKK